MVLTQKTYTHVLQISVNFISLYKKKRPNCKMKSLE